MTESRSYTLGAYGGRDYILALRANPGFGNPEGFAVTVYFRDELSDTNVQIARIDTADGFTHFDRLYRRDEQKDPVDLSLWEAVEELSENWRTYAKMYDQKQP
jgi:hypothetical protein